MKRLAEEGMDVPSLRDMPQITPCYMWLWAAFGQLSEKRMRIQGVPQPIPTSEIVAYAQIKGIREEFQLDLLYRCVSALDTVLVDHHMERIAEANKKRADDLDQVRRQRR